MNQKPVTFVQSLKSPNVPSVGVILASFDPIHAGHQHMIETCLKKFGAVVLLLPELHFEKNIVFPFNLSLEQRLETLKLLYGRNINIGFGVAKEVLFIRLQKALKTEFPRAEIHLAMGNDTFECLLDSKSYYEKLDLPWTTEDAEGLRDIVKSCLVFGRLPKDSVIVREIDSSSDVRLRDSQCLQAFSMDKAFAQLGVSNLGRSQNGSNDVLVRSITNEGNSPIDSKLQRVSSTHIRERIATIWGSSKLVSEFQRQVRKELQGYLDLRVLDYVLKVNAYHNTSVPTDSTLVQEEGGLLSPTIITIAVVAVAGYFLYQRLNKDQ